MAEFSLTEEQQQAVESRGGSLLVSAAAGSGKTRVLVERLLGRMEEEQANLDRFLVITYTKAAAGELRGRIGKELSARLQQAPTDGFLRRQSTYLYAAQISTIHAYCASLIRENTHRLNLNPNFRQMEEADAALLQQQVMDELLEQRYARLDEFPGFEALSEMVSGSYDDQRLVNIALDIHRRIQSHPNPRAWLAEQRATVSPDALGNLSQTPWGPVLRSRAERYLSYACSLTQRAVDRCIGDEQLEERCAPQLEEGLSLLQEMVGTEGLSWDALRRAIAEFSFPRFKPIKEAADPAGKQTVTDLRNLAKKQVEKAGKLLRDDEASALAAMVAIGPAMTALFNLIEDFSDAFSAAKLAQGCLDFGDLEHLALRLLVNDGQPTELAKRESERFVEVMVDEYQDTNAVQNAIFDAISGGGERLFMVGDVKQSIYRFRLAEPEIFLAKSKSFPFYTDLTQTGSRKVVLSQNFRSRHEVLDAANEVFAAIMSPDCGGLYYDSEAWLNGIARESRDDCATEFTVIDTAAEESDDEQPAGQTASPYLLEARYVAARIARLMEEKSVTGEGEKARPLRYDDIAILRHSLKSTLRYITQALDERSIPWVMEAGEEFFGTPEVEIALAMLQIIDNPRQDIPLISVLRSPVYAFSADRLAILRADHPQGDFLAAVEAAEANGDNECKVFLLDLNDLREQVGRVPLYRFIWQLFDQTNLFGIVGAMPQGEARQSRLLTLAEAARNFEQSSQKGLFAFLTYLETLRERGESVGQSTGRSGDGVQIKTIHRSKGLEFPVVFLMGMGGTINLTDAREPMLFHPKLGVGPQGFDSERRLRYPTIARDAVQQLLHNETKSEAMRLLYVGMTRPKEKLIMTCTMKDAPSALSKLACEVTLPFAPQAIENMDKTGKWIAAVALTRPEGGALRQLAGGDVPVNHRLEGAPWEISMVSGANYEQEPKLADSPYLEQRPMDAQASETLVAQYVWQYPYSADDIPSKLTATGLKGRFVDEEVQQDAPPPPPQDVLFEPPVFVTGERALTAAERGTALHLAMQFMDYRQAGDAPSLAAELARLKSLEILTAQQVDAIEPQRILNLFATPLGRELRENSSLRREFKFSVLVPAADYYDGVSQGEQVLLQGVVDAFYETPEGLVVVDFKTDRVTEQTVHTRVEEYRPQLEAYTRALAEITGKPVVRRVLWFFALGRELEL